MRTINHGVGKVIEVILAIIAATLLICLSIAVLPVVGTMYLIARVRGHHGFI